MNTVKAILESYDTSCRVTPESPLNTKSGGELKRQRAEVLRWSDTGAMDIFFLPPPNPLAASTRVVQRFPWGGSVVRSIYGSYRINLSYADATAKAFTAEEQVAHLREAMRWIAEDKKTFVPEPQPHRKRRR